jgi:hypothetical protein
MAVAQGYGKTTTSGSVFAYDTGDTRNSYKGRPTSNLLTGYTLYSYNNVSGNVTTTITATSETYKGATVYKQTITPLDSTGVSYLTNANNPGIGVYTGGGGGLANRYTGHSIFFKPTGPLYSTPIFTSYSNIGGWQSTADYEDMGDGWFKAKVIWYDTVTRSDGKHWAINPSGATINVPITIYWAGPFKEDLNSTTISQFVEGTRSVTQGLLPLVGTNTIDLTNTSFDSNAQPIFDGTSNNIRAIVSSNKTNVTMEGIVYVNLGTIGTYLSNGDDAGGYCIGIGQYFNTTDNQIVGLFGAIRWILTGAYYQYTGYHHIAMTLDGSSVPSIYVNGALIGTYSGTVPNNTSAGTGFCMGSQWGIRYSNTKIPVSKFYSRALTQAEITKNYRHYKTRFNLG